LKILVFILVAWSSITHANEKKLSQEHQEVAEFFVQYLNNYNDYFENPDNTKALSAAAQDIHLPAVQIQPQGSVAMLESAQQIVLGTQGFIESLKAKGVTHMAWEKLQINVLSEHAAVASNVAAQYLEDGYVYARLGATYLLYKTDKGWKLVSRVLHLPEDVLRLKS